MRSSIVGAVTASLEEDLVDVDGTYARWLEHLDAAAVLIRPDYYVFGAVDHADEVDAPFFSIWAVR